MDVPNYHFPSYDLSQHVNDLSEELYRSAEERRAELERRHQEIVANLSKTSEILGELSKSLDLERKEREHQEKILRRQNAISLGIAITSALTTLIAAGFQIADFFINC